MAKMLTVLGIAVALYGCASPLKTRGTSGPVEWLATEGSVTTAPRTWTYRFTLVLTNRSPRTLTLSNRHEDNYRGAAGHGWDYPGTWVVPGNGEVRLPIAFTLWCLDVGNCIYTSSPTMYLVYTGVDDRAQPVKFDIDLRLPADPQALHP